MPRKGENIYKRKDGRWEGRYLKRIPGQKTRYGYVYAKTYREVKAKLREAATQWEQLPEVALDAPCLSHVAREWFEHLAPQVKQSTLVKYHTILHRHLLPALGDVALTDMTFQRIEAFSQQLLQTLAPRTVSDILSVLRSILRYAMRFGHQVPCDGSAVRIRRTASQIRILTPGEQAILCRHIFEDLTLRNAGILLSLCTGLRIGEICALRWEDISFDDRLLHVRHTMQRLQNLSPVGARTQIVETAPKSATSARTIPLTEDLVRVLLSLPGCHSGYFLTGHAKYFIEPRTMQYHFGRMMVSSGLSPANYHALRHTFATRCVELGFDVKSLSEILGHSTVTMTMDRYVHPTLEHKRAGMQQLTVHMTANWNRVENFL